MKKAALFGAITLIAAVSAALSTTQAHAAPTPGVCTTSGTTTFVVTCGVGTDDTWTVPSGVGVVTVDLKGAGGGVSANMHAANTGGDTTATVTVAPGTTYHIAVGQQGGPGSASHGGIGGAPGGAAGSACSMCSLGGGGGGGTSILATATPTADVSSWLLAAGGAGGTGESSDGEGGAGGGTSGGDGSNLCGTAQGGGQTLTTGSMQHLNGSTAAPTQPGGGGGGGYVGGAGAPGACGGGGGSGFIASSGNIASASTTQGGGSTGDGAVTITYTPCTPASGGSTTVPSSGATCLSGGSAGGNLTVPAGGTLVLNNAHVGGNLNANGASAVVICGSTIGGSVTISNTTGQVLVGDAGDDGSPGCAPNTVGNGVTLTANTANTELGGNHITGNVKFTNNTGTPSGTEDGPEIEANNIGGTLTCTGNTPAPVNGSQLNTVAGARSGQCSAKTF